MMKKIMVLFLLIVLMAELILAYYTNGDIYIYDNGNARFNIKTDKELILDDIEFQNNKLIGATDLFTKKEDGIWTLFLDLGYYDEIFIDIHLPKNLDYIKSIEGIDNIIDINNKIITLIDKNKSLEFRVDYKLNNDFYLEDYYLLITILVILILAFIYYKWKKYKKLDDRLNYILPIINDNEKLIIKNLMRRNYRQKDLRKMLKIPKASFARYIINLERKKLIAREGEGRNKILRLK